MKAENRSTRCPDLEPGRPGVLRDAVMIRGRTPDDDPGPEQIKIYRRMTPGRRLEVAEQMYWSARRMKHAWLRTLHPDWTGAEIEAEVTRNFSHARS